MKPDVATVKFKGEPQNQEKTIEKEAFHPAPSQVWKIEMWCREGKLARGPGWKY